MLVIRASSPAVVQAEPAVRRSSTGGPGWPNGRWSCPRRSGRQQPPGRAFSEREQQQHARVAQRPRERRHARGRRRAPRSARTTSSRYGPPRQPMPAARRTVLSGPSHPATKLQLDRLSASPASGGLRGRSETPSWTLISSMPRSTSIPRSASARASTDSTSCCRTSVRCGNAVSGRARSASRTRRTTRRRDAGRLGGRRPPVPATAP